MLVLADYLPHCVTVRMPEPMPQVPACREVFDLPFLQLAVAGKAEALVTGDRDLLALAPTFACPVISAEHFLVQLVMK